MADDAKESTSDYGDQRTGGRSYELQSGDKVRSLTDETIRAGAAIRDNIAVLTTATKDSIIALCAAIDKATNQAKESSQSAGKLAKSLNRITAGLVIVGVLQVIVGIFQLIILFSHR